jgi:hypothetical protein
VPKLGDGPIDPQYHQLMNTIASVLDEAFNGQVKGAERQTGFVLLVFPFHDHEGRCNYISNGADRKDICTLFREQIARFEGMPDITGKS